MVHTETQIHIPTTREDSRLQKEASEPAQHIVAGFKKQARLVYTEWHDQITGIGTMYRNFCTVYGLDPPKFRSKVPYISYIFTHTHTTHTYADLND